jgi:hypothetical protein
MMRQFDDADQAVSWAAILLFLDAVFDAPQILRALIGGVSYSWPFWLFVALVAGKVAAGAGLLKTRRWAWLLALAVAAADGLLALLRFPFGFLALLFDAAIIYLVLRPAVRERFGQR